VALISQMHGSESTECFVGVLGPDAHGGRIYIDIFKMLDFDLL
jgi:hypothetical protein